MSTRLALTALLGLVLGISACSAYGTPRPVSNPDGSYTLEARTGIEDIDNVLAALESEDRAQLERLLQYEAAPCTNREGFGGPPKCREGEEQGTVIEAIPLIGSEGSMLRKTDLDQWSGVEAESLFAVYRVGETGVEEEYYPRGEYGIVLLTKQSGAAVVLRVIDGAIVRVDHPFYLSLRELQEWVERDASEVILMPDVR